MYTYKREDGAVCTAMQFMGSTEDFMENRFHALDLLIKANLQPTWHAEEESDEWVENEEGDDYIHPIIPEHITLAANHDELKVGDYIVIRDDTTYIMDGQMFEAIWGDPVEEPIPAAVRTADICINCGRQIANFDREGRVFRNFRHTSGPNTGAECSIFDTNGEDGFFAAPRKGNNE